MLKIQGDLDLMTLPEILQWAEMGRKNGTLVISKDAVRKHFFFQEGKIIYFVSPMKGERLGEALVKGQGLARAQLEQALEQSKKLGIPFTAYLVLEKVITPEKLESVMELLVRAAIKDSLSWSAAGFEFQEHLPEQVRSGLVKLKVSTQLFVSAVQYDEGAGLEHDTDQIMARLSGLIEDGQIALPSTPDIMQKLRKTTQEDQAATSEIVKIIMADQILISKILKVVNSSFYGFSKKINTLQHAVNIIGIKALVSIATAHALGNMSAGDEKKIRPILHHSLLTAFIAKKIGKMLRQDTEELFVCGIMHDLGKTVLMDYLAQFDLPENAIYEILRRHHAHVGYLLAKNWRLSELHQETIRCHHEPPSAGGYALFIKIIHHADALAHGIKDTDYPAVFQRDLGLGEERLTEIITEIDALDSLASTLI